MKKANIISQLLNLKTKLFYINNCKSIAQNVFPILGLPDYIDDGYVNNILINEGSIAFFKDEVLGLLALPYTNLGGLDVYNRPIRIQVLAPNGYTRTLNRNEFVIMYDNKLKIPIIEDIEQFATRLSNLERAKDVNINQLKIPRIWQCSQEQLLSLQKLLDDIESNNEKIITYNGLDLETITSILQPIPNYLKEFSEEQKNIWNQFLAYIGVTNLTINKKERLIRDEVLSSQGGTLIMKLGRFEARKKAIKKINEIFGEKLDVIYYEDYVNNMLEKKDEEED